MKNLYALFVLSLLALQLPGQGTNLPLGNPAYHILDRLEIKTGLPLPHHSSLKYYTRGAAARYALQVEDSTRFLSRLDQQDLRYIYRDNNEWLGQTRYPTTLTGPKERPHPDSTEGQIARSLADPRYERSDRPIFNTFYETPANLLEVNERFFHLRLNPVINFKAGNLNEGGPYIYNRRGVVLRGGIDDRVYFYSSILETQTQPPNHVEEWVRQFNSFPGQGFFKPFDDDFFNITDGYDYLNGQGYLGFNFSRHIGLQFGYGRNFIGNGYRSVLLSDFSDNYFHLKLNWNVWKIHYQNIFAELAVRSAFQAPRRSVVEKKFMAAHHLSINILPNLNIGIFEAVIFDRPDQFEFNYLNPLILYRTVEGAVGSPDNVLLGLDAKWNFLNRFQLYGQILFDEFNFDLFFNADGWWGRKYSGQIGGKYIDAFGIDHLDLQAEYNLARPFTYSHVDSIASYSHYNQPLAHPLGANFRETVLIARYQPLHRLVIEGRLLNATYGEDRGGQNFGGNILLPNVTRVQEFGNETAQGATAEQLTLGLDVSYQLRHNLFLEVHYFSRDKDSVEGDLDLTTRYLGGGIRWNVNWVRYDF